MEVNADDYFTYEGRLASFRASHKRRGSSVRGKAMKWPHAHLEAESLARAGWFYAPHPSHIDQVICFLCRKGLDGWEEGDDPLLEHLVHAPGCGWAVVAAVEAEVEGYEAQDPKDKRMVEARKGTFGGRWPHEGKKGWKCKTKQLAEAGWKYTPTPESDDMATCAYCQLALDGWEPSDKPLDEHHSRSPDCPFFTYIDPNPSKKPARGRGVRASKASRASAQSTGMGTFISEAPSMLDATTGIDDSVLTTTSKRGRPKKVAKEEFTEDPLALDAPPEVDDSVVTTTAKRGRPKKSTKGEAIESLSTLDAPAEVDDSVLTTTSKRGRPKKAAPKAAKGRKTKAKKEEPEPEEDSDAPREETEELEELAPPPPKAKRGKKRASEAIEESTLAAAEAPAPKRRATRAKAKSTAAAAADASVLSVANHDVEMEDAMDTEPAAKAGPKKGRASSAKARKASASRLRSTASTASMRSAASELPDDDEIDRQLEADLERPLTDEEDLAADSDSERQRKTRREKVQQRGESGDYAMFDPAPVAVDEEVVEAEFMALEEEARKIDGEEKEAEVVEEKLVVPKKGKKAGTTRKASAPRKASRAKKAKAEPVPEPVVEAEPEPVPEPEAMESEHEPEPEQEPEPEPERVFVPEIEEEADAPVAIHEDPEPEPEEQSEHDNSIASTGTVVIKAQAEENAAPAKRGRGRPPKKQSSARRSSVESKRNDSHTEEARPPVVPRHQTPVIPGAWGVEADEVDSEPELVVMSPGEQRSPIPRALPPIPLSTSRRPPANVASPAMSRHAPSPSQSPQSSDAENQPPSTKRSGKTARVRLQRPATPNTILNSPTKRTVVAGVRSAVAWEPVDIELVLQSPVAGTDMAGRLGGVGPLGSPERRMTVEEWIHHSAGRAEAALREECEGLVGRFEAEGVRAMRVLEGLRTE